MTPHNILRSRLFIISTHRDSKSTVVEDRSDLILNFKLSLKKKPTPPAFDRLGCDIKL
jgi:hypothetical protein